MSAYPDQLREGMRPHSAARLYYVTWPDPKPGTELQTQGVPATVRIDVRKFRDTELAAWRAHVSQQALQRRFDALAASDEELFALAAGIAQPKPIIADLFEGL